MIRIKELKLKNFRGFHQKDEEGEDTEIEIIFPDSNLIVFIGENGSGKTSILDAIGILLNNMIGYITDPFDIWGDDSKIDKKLETKINEFYNQKHFEENNLNIFESDINNHDEKSFDGTEIQLKIEKTDLRTEVRVQSDWNLSGIFKGKQYFREANFDQLKNLKKLYEYILRSTNKENQRADIFVYYNISRLQAEDNKKESKKYPFDQYNAYQNSFNKDNKFSYFYQWFSELYTYENNIVSRKDVNFRHPELEPIRIALEEFFSKKNLNYDLSDFRIDYDKRNKPLLFATKNQTEHLSVNQLSDGERTLLLLVADIARRLTIANKEIIQDNIENAHLILNGTGIIIIDEIDLHLHPKWQRLVVPALMNTFPKIQFIVTTHSPFVIQSLIGYEVITVQDKKIKANEINANDISEVIKNVFHFDDFFDSEVNSKINELLILRDDVKKGNYNTEKLKSIKLWKSTRELQERQKNIIENLVREVQEIVDNSPPPYT